MVAPNGLYLVDSQITNGKFLREDDPQHCGGGNVPLFRTALKFLLQFLRQAAVQHGGLFLLHGGGFLLVC